LLRGAAVLLALAEPRLGCPVQAPGHHGDQQADKHGLAWPAPGPFPGSFQGSGRSGQDGSAVEPALEVVGQGRGAAVAFSWYFLQALQADGLQVPIHPRIVHTGRCRLALDDLQQRFQRQIGLEGRPPRQQLVEDGAQAVDVRRRSQLLATLGLFGRHVTGRADNRSGLGNAQTPFPGRMPLHALGQAKVGYMRFALSVEQDVGRFQVAVQNAALMGIMHRPGNCNKQADSLARMIGPLSHLLG